MKYVTWRACGSETSFWARRYIPVTARYLSAGSAHRIHGQYAEAYWRDHVIHQDEAYKDVDAEDILDETTKRAIIDEMRCHTQNPFDPGKTGVREKLPSV